MAATDTLAARVRGALQRLEATPVELAALAALVCGGLVLFGALWWLTPVGGDGPAADADALHPGSAADGRDVEDHSAGGDSNAGSDHGLALGAEDVIVHVAGAVEAPGLHELPGGARIADAIAAAGGVTGDAVLDGVNLARPVRDGEQLHVPDQATIDAAADSGGSPPNAAGGPGHPGGAQRPDGRLDLNRADAAALETLPGVGPVLAERIISHREAHGPFTRPEDLLDVSGIGERTFEALTELVDT